MSSIAANSPTPRALVEHLSYADVPFTWIPAHDDAVLAAYKYLITHRMVSRIGFVANVYPHSDAGLPAKDWYDDLTAPLLPDLPGVTPLGPRTAIWRYASESDHHYLPMSEGSQQ